MESIFHGFGAKFFSDSLGLAESSGKYLPFKEATFRYFGTSSTKNTVIMPIFIWHKNCHS
jgi:hypothetical protein